MKMVTARSNTFTVDMHVVGNMRNLALCILLLFSLAISIMPEQFAIHVRMNSLAIKTGKHSWFVCVR